MLPITLKTIKKYSFYFILGIIFFYSCGGKKGVDGSLSDEFDKEKIKGTNKSVKEVLKELPEPSRVPGILLASGADFSPDLVNDHRKVENYESDTKSAMNLGLYATDIGYLISYDKMQDALKYMQSAKKLADALGIANAMDKDMIENFESNITSKDSLLNILNGIIDHADDHLSKSDRANLATLMLAGSFIEGLYIATQIVKSYPDDLLSNDQRNLILTPIIRMVLDQEKSLDNLILLLKDIESEEWSHEIIHRLEELKMIYHKIDIRKLLHEHRADLVLSEKRLEAITVQLEQIRNNIAH